jgi:endonuclease/exonuclease/phosphatase family metal-dependent hydrolase
MIRVATWNLKWATPALRRGQILRDALIGLSADIVCVTESCESMLPSNGHAIVSDADYGYSSPQERRKVLLWSREPWADIDTFGSAELPSGRFIAGTTITPLGQVRVFGLCIPWRDAHVRTGRRDRTPWQDHLSFLNTIPEVLGKDADLPAFCLGDLNQRIPALPVRSALKRALEGWHTATAGRIPPLGVPSIDHIAHQQRFRMISVRGLPKYAEDGLELSDHFGVVGDFELSHAAQEAG